MIFQPNRLQQKNFAQLKNTSEYAKMVSKLMELNTKFEENESTLLESGSQTRTKNPFLEYTLF